MNKLPLEIRRACFVNKRDEGWYLNVFDSGEKFFIPRPQKGQNINPVALQSVLEHINSLPKSAEEVEEIEIVHDGGSEPNAEEPPACQEFEPLAKEDTEKLLTFGQATKERPVLNQPPPLTVSDYPNSYTVDLMLDTGRTVAIWARNQEQDKYNIVQRVNNKLTVLIKASNSKHALVIGEHMLHKHRANNLIQYFPTFGMLGGVDKSLAKH